MFNGDPKTGTAGGWEPDLTTSLKQQHQIKQEESLCFILKNVNLRLSHGINAYCIRGNNIVRSFDQFGRTYSVLIGRPNKKDICLHMNSGMKIIYSHILN